MKRKDSSVWNAVRFLLRYIVQCKWLTLLCTLCVLLGAGANIAAPYLLKPIINQYIPCLLYTSSCV